MANLSAVILTRNNERTIERAVGSLRGLAAELIVVDDGSTDKTLNLVRTAWPEAKIFFRSLDRFDAQRNFGLSQTTRDWIVMIDSDEELSTALRDLILSELQSPRHDLYRSWILNEAFGRTVKIKLERPLLFRSGLKFENALHETISGSAGFLPADLLHHSWLDAADWIEDMNNYSTHQAKKWLMQNRNYSPVALALIALIMPPYHFFKLVFYQSRWRNGFFAGFLYPAACAAEWWFSVLKYYEYRYINKSEAARDIK